MGLWHIFRTFFKIGLVTFGGGYAMFAVMERELVGRLRWLEKDVFLDLAAMSQGVPGALAVNFATLAGNRIRGRHGAIAAFLGVILPSLIVIYCIARFLEPWMEHPLVRSGFGFLAPAVIGIMLASVVQLAKGAGRGIPVAALMFFGFIGLTVLGLHPVLIILAAGSLGFAVSGRAAE